MKNNPVQIPGTRIITISGRIACGSTTLANRLAELLGWRHIEGGEVFWEALRAKMGVSDKDTHLRPDSEDQDFDTSLKQVLKEGENIVLETKLAGFNAQGINGVFKIAVICENEEGKDQTEIRIDRLVNREKISIKEAKEEVIDREESDLEKWRRLYADNNQEWVYWDSKYYDLIINTYSHNPEQSLEIALKALGL